MAAVVVLCVDGIATPQLACSGCGVATWDAALCATLHATVELPSPFNAWHGHAWRECGLRGVRVNARRHGE